MRPHWGLLAPIIFVSACGGDTDDELHVLAAASLVDVAAAFEADYEAAAPGVDVVINSAGSNALVQLVNQGAEVDVFLPANREVLDRLEVAHDDLGTLATNSLTIAVPPGNPADVTSVDDLARPELLIAACAVGVPCGDATVQLPVEVAADTFESNVRQVAAKVAAGEVDAGVVYVSDIAALDGIEEVRIPANVTATVEIPIVLVGEAGTDFAAFAQGSRGRELLAQAGFATT